MTKVDTTKLAKVLEEMKLDYIYNSYALDSYTYGKDTVSAVVYSGVPTEALTKKDILYIGNFARAYEYWSDLVVNKYYTDIKEDDFLQIHRLMMQDVDNDNAGEYRRVCAVTTEERRLMPVPMKLPYIMGDIFYDIEHHNGNDVLDFAIDIHFRILSAYPFVEKNKDMARFMFNAILLTAGYISVPIIFNIDAVDIYAQLEKENLNNKKETLRNYVERRL